MSVLSRHRHHTDTAAPDTWTGVPSPRTASPSEGARASDTAIRPRTPAAPAPTDGRRTAMLVLGGIAVAAAIGVGTYAVLDDGSSPSVVAPGPADAGTSITDADRLSEAQRDAAWAGRGTS